jgi:hypothetical protein
LSASRLVIMLPSLSEYILSKPVAEVKNFFSISSLFF